MTNVANTPETLEWLRKLSFEGRKIVLDEIQKCGCICHTAHAMHFRSCCEFTYVKMFNPESV